MKAATDKPGQLGTRHVARQPILTADEKVYGYELLFRDGVQYYFNGLDPDAASRTTVDTSLLIGLDVLCDSRRAFINCTRDVLLKDYMTLLPPKKAVAEIVKGVPPDELVIAACQRLKKAGFLIALDNFTMEDERMPPVELADILKVDIEKRQAWQPEVVVKRFASKDRHILAAKVETREEFSAALLGGFEYFQGYFFRQPELMQAREIPANRINYLRLLKAISSPEWEPGEIENIIKGEASLCYRLLRYLNSPVFGLAAEVQTVRHGLAILGERELRRWIRLAATLIVGQNKTSDLVLSALVRGRFGELLSPKLNGNGDSDLFLLGMLSLMDSILEVPMGVVLDGIPLQRDLRNALLGADGPLFPILQLMAAQERGDWPTVSALCERLHLPDAFVGESHCKAMQWARQMTSAV